MHVYIPDTTIYTSTYSTPVPHHPHSLSLHRIYSVNNRVHDRMRLHHHQPIAILQNPYREHDQALLTTIYTYVYRSLALSNKHPDTHTHIFIHLYTQTNKYIYTYQCSYIGMYRKDDSGK